MQQPFTPRRRSALGPVAATILSIALLLVPGLARASARNSLKSLAGSCGFTAMMFGTVAIVDTGMKPFTGSYGSLANIAGFTASVPTWPRISV